MGTASLRPRTGRTSSLFGRSMPRNSSVSACTVHTRCDMLTIMMIGAGAQDGGRQVKGGRRRIRKPAFELETDGDGMPLLPDIMEMKLEEKKAIVRAFLTSHYRESVLTTLVNFLNAWPQECVPGKTRQLYRGAPSHKVRMTLWKAGICRRVST